MVNCWRFGWWTGSARPRWLTNDTVDRFSQLLNAGGALEAGGDASLGVDDEDPGLALELPGLGRRGDDWPAIGGYQFSFGVQLERLDVNEVHLVDELRPEPLD